MSPAQYRVGDSRKRYTFEDACKRAGAIFERTGVVVAVTQTTTRAPKAILSPAILATVRVVKEYGGRYWVEWRDQDEGARFHYWFTLPARPGESLTAPGYIFKNPIANRGEPGHFQTRTLDGEKPRNVAIATLIAAEVTARDLVGKARAEYREKQNQADEAQRRAIRLHRVKEHGESTLAALKGLTAAFRECVGAAAFAEFEASNAAVITARAAIEAAEGVAP